MKVTCEVYKVNRLQPQLKNRWIKSTIAIGSHPPDKEVAEFFLLHFTSTNRSGVRYRIKDNIVKVFLKCLSQGKATISLKDPQLDLQIKGDPMQMKSFLNVLKLALQGKKLDENGRSLVPPIASTTKYEPVKTKMTIQSRKDYPIKPFPKTLVQLSITGIKLLRVDSKVFALNNLTELNLCDNRIEQIPDKLGDLALQSLDLSNNNLCKSSWKWLRGRTLQASLSSLDLSGNELTHFPTELVNLRSLARLLIANNQIKLLPFSIRAMYSLRFLSVADNLLNAVPENLRLLRLEELDVSHNPLIGSWDSIELLDTPFRKSSSLLEVAAQCVTRHGISYAPMTIPRILCNYMDLMPLCRCGNICFNASVVKNVADFRSNYKPTIVKSFASQLRVDAVFCSLNCFQKKNHLT